MSMTNQTDVLEMPFSTMEFGIGLLGVAIALASAYLLLKIYKLEKLNIVPRCKIEYQANCGVSGHHSDGKFEFINKVIVENSGGDAEQPMIWFRTVLKNGKILKSGPERLGRIAKGQRIIPFYHRVLIDKEEFENVDEVFCLLKCLDISNNEYFAFSSFKYKSGFKRKAVNSALYLVGRVITHTCVSSVKQLIQLQGGGGIWVSSQKPKDYIGGTKRKRNFLSTILINGKENMVVKSMS